LSGLCDSDETSPDRADCDSDRADGDDRKLHGSVDRGGLSGGFFTVSRTALCTRSDTSNDGCAISVEGDTSRDRSDSDIEHADGDERKLHVYGIEKN